MIQPQIYDDTLKAELNIYKTDAETGNRIPVADVEFGMKRFRRQLYQTTVSYPSKYETDIFKIDENGAMHLSEVLIYGTYSIVEIKTPYGCFKR